MIPITLELAEQTYVDFFGKPDPNQKVFSKRMVYGFQVTKYNPDKPRIRTAPIVVFRFDRHIWLNNERIGYIY